MRSQRANLYDDDFVEWTRHNAELLRARRFDQADVVRIAGEIEEMGKRDLKELNSRMQVLLAHLLEWQLQPAKRSNSWKATITAQRSEIADEIEQSPSLKSRLHAALPRNHAKAVLRAAGETGLPHGRFAAECPFNSEQIFDPEYLP